MLDLLHLVQEDGATLPAEKGPNKAKSGEYQQGTTRTPSGNGHAPSSESSAHQSGTGSKSSGGLFAKYKSMKERRRSQGSDTGDDKQGANGDPALLDYSPLGKGENGEGRVDIEATSSTHSDQDGGRSVSLDSQNSTFMGKMRAYRNKQRSKSLSKGNDGLDDSGPLQQGLTPKGNHKHKQAQMAQPARNASMREFFDRVSEAKALLAKVTERERGISAARERSRKLASSAEVQAAQAEIQEDIDDVTAICKQVKNKLLELDGINSQLLSDDQDEDDLVDHPELQMRLSVMAGLNAKLSEVTRGWQQMQSQWQDEDREEVALQLHTVTGQHFAADEVDELVHNGGTEQIYRQAMASANGAMVQQLMSDVQQRHDQMRQLEASMLELHQVFLDMSILVADQGDTINSIDNWVCSTASTMRESLRQLRAAKESRRKAATTKAVTFVTGVGLVAGGAGLTATGFGAVAGIPMMVAGAAAVGGSAIGGIR